MNYMLIKEEINDDITIDSENSKAEWTLPPKQYTSYASVVIISYKLVSIKTRLRLFALTSYYSLTNCCYFSQIISTISRSDII